MADIDKRLKYYNGQFLREQDFTAEQEYHLDRMRRHAGQLHTPGVADGLNVTATVGAVSAVVSPGTALDKEGRQIFLREPFNVAFESSHNGQWVLVVIAYAQEPADEATVGDVGMTRWLERPEVTVVLESGAPPADVRIRLARLRIAANGTIAEHDPSVRTPAGARVRPHERFESLRLSRPGSSDSSQWPVLTSGAANRADLAGSLSVNGNIAVTGTVDGRDVSADGAKLDNLALSQIDGVSNPGGNIDLVAGGAISISPDDANNRITISETHSALTGNPHGTLASQLADYDFKSVYSDSLYFWELYGDNATLTFDLGFQPRLVYVNGYAQAWLSGWLGGPINGIARIVNNSIIQHGCGPYITRQSAAPYILSTGVANSGLVAYSHYYNSTVSPAISAGMTIKVSATTPTSVTFMLNRPATVPLFDFWFHFTCFGH